VGWELGLARQSGEGARGGWDPYELRRNKQQEPRRAHRERQGKARQGGLGEDTTQHEYAMHSAPRLATRTSAARTPSSHCASVSIFLTREPGIFSMALALFRALHLLQASAASSRERTQWSCKKLTNVSIIVYYLKYSTVLNG